MELTLARCKCALIDLWRKRIPSWSKRDVRSRCWKSACPYPRSSGSSRVWVCKKKFLMRSCTLSSTATTSYPAWSPTILNASFRSLIRRLSTKLKMLKMQNKLSYSSSISSCNSSSRSGGMFNSRIHWCWWIMRDVHTISKNWTFHSIREVSVAKIMSESL